MSVVRVEPSELHWKKELAALQKAARLLRDPETSSSLRSPLSTRSAVASSRLKWVKSTRGNSSRSSHAGDFRYPLKSGPKFKEVSLHNWRDQASNLSESRVKLDGQEVSSVPESPNDSLSKSNKAYSRNDPYLENPLMVFKEENVDKPVKKTVKKLKKRAAMSRQRSVRNSKRLNLPTISSKEQLTPSEQSYDMGYCNSEDRQILDQGSDEEVVYSSSSSSRSASPLLSKYGKWPKPPKHLKTKQKDESSVSRTPTSTSSYNRYGYPFPNNVGSWDGTTPSLSGNSKHIDLSRYQGGRIPSSGSKRSLKYRGWGGSRSPSLSDTIRRKGSSMLCGSRKSSHKHHSSRSNRQKHVTRSVQGSQLLTYSVDGRRSPSIDTEQSDDGLSTNFGELELEALSRLDGRRWSLSCRSQEGLEIVNVEDAKERMPDHIRSLSQKYRPIYFHDIIGQNIVVQTLSNSILRGRIAPAYLFHGPRGTGKTSIARIFACALNCLDTEETIPCGSCRECSDFISGVGGHHIEVPSTNKKATDRVRYQIKTLSTAAESFISHYTVFVIDECHLLPSKTWSSFLKFLEEPPLNVVFIFITTNLDNIPHAVLSRCKKYLFNKIKDADIVTRLTKLSADEGLEVDAHALNLIALNADGSLWEAETMLEQLSLLGKRITPSLVNELVGVVSDEKLLDLLELAMSSETAETVKKARELMDSGVDPIALMSQLAGLVMDIIAGTYRLLDSNCKSSFFGGQSLTEAETERLKQALKLLSEAEKQLRVSSERQTWFTAALLQLGSVTSQDSTNSSSSRKQSSKSTEENESSTSREFSSYKRTQDSVHIPQKSTSSSSTHKAESEPSIPFPDQLSKVENRNFDANSSCSQFFEGDDNVIAESSVVKQISQERLDEIWERCIDKCHSKTLRQLLHDHGTLVSILKTKGVLIASILFNDGDVKSRAERFLSSITNSFEIVLKYNVEVKLELAPYREACIEPAPENMMSEREHDLRDLINSYSPLDPLQRTHELPEDSINGLESKLIRVLKQSSFSVAIKEEEIRKEGKQEAAPQNTHTIIEEQRMESAWSLAADKGNTESLSRPKPEGNQVLPQDSLYVRSNTPRTTGKKVASQNWDEELNHELHAGKRFQKEQSDLRFGRYPMSPSLLHNSSIDVSLKKDNRGYESGSSTGRCNGIFCWKTRRPRNNRVQIKQGNTIRSHINEEFPTKARKT